MRLVLLPVHGFQKILRQQGKKRKATKNIWRNSDENIFKIDANYSLTDSKSVMDSKLKKYEENDTKTHCNQISQNKVIRSWKQAETKRHVTYTEQM